MNFTTEQVQLFPTTFRTIVPEGKFTSEKNFTNILKSINNKESYIIETPSTMSAAEGELLKFVIGGYYFEIKNFKFEELGLTKNELWAQIKVENNSHSIINYSNNTTSLDQNNYFEGLNLSTDENKTLEKGYTIYNLQLIKANTSGNPEWVKYNKVRLGTDSIYYSSSVNLTDELDSKQYNLTPVSPIIIDNDCNIKLKQSEVDKLNALSASGEGAISHKADGTLIYFDDKGKANNQSTFSKGGYIANSGSAYKINQAICVDGGVIKVGPEFYISTKSPTKELASLGKTGDFWFKYSEESIGE